MIKKLFKYIEQDKIPEFYDETLDYLLAKPYSWTKLLNFIHLNYNKETKLAIVDAKSLSAYCKIKLEDLIDVIDDLKDKNILVYRANENGFSFNPLFLRMRIVRKLRLRHPKAPKGKI